MSATKIKQELSCDQFEQVLSLPVNLQGIAYEALTAMRKIKNLHAYCKKVQRFEDRSCGAVSLDAYSLSKEAQDPNVFDDLIIVSGAEAISLSRATTLSDMSEFLFSTLDSAANLGRARGKTPRRGQQILAAQIQREVEAQSFNNGGSGQGALFGFDGEVPA